MSGSTADRRALVLEAVGVGLYLSGSTILHGVSLTVSRGEVVALTGPSGSGKSSLLYCLSGLVRPSEGTVHLDGTNLTSLSAELAATARRRSMGFVFQSAELVPELSLRENVALPLRLQGVKRREALERADVLLARLDLGARAQARPAFVSGGQAQRAAIARAVIHEPAIVFADEPTGALDTRNGAVALEALTTLADAGGTSVVLVTHDSRVAERADRTYVLEDGELAPASSAPLRADRGAR